MKEIRQIIARYEATDFESESIAIASVVSVEESSYRRIGARMLVSSNGNWTGGISGGCLEGDALKRSQQAIFRNSPSRVVYDTMDDDANQIGVGLGCNGRIEVLFSPIEPDNPNNPIEILKRIDSENKPVVLISVIEVETSQDKLGSSIIVHANEKPKSFLGIDDDFLNAKVQMAYQKKRSIIAETNRKGEKIKLLFEFIRPEMRLAIVGDNYDVNALVGLLAELGWDIYLVGRKKKMHLSTFHKAKAVFEYEQFDEVPIDDYTSVLLMTHDYNWDKTILKKIISQKPIYIGMLGPKKRRIKMENEEGLENISQLDFLYSPVGLDIGAESPEEIAISIISEILAVHREREGGQLRLRKGTIHNRF